MPIAGAEKRSSKKELTDLPWVQISSLSSLQKPFSVSEQVKTFKNEGLVMLTLTNKYEKVWVQNIKVTCKILKSKQLVGILEKKRMEREQRLNANVAEEKKLSYDPDRREKTKMWQHRMNMRLKRKVRKAWQPIKASSPRVFKYQSDCRRRNYRPFSKALSSALFSQS